MKMKLQIDLEIPFPEDEGDLFHSEVSSCLEENMEKIKAFARGLAGPQVIYQGNGKDTKQVAELKIII